MAQLSEIRTERAKRTFHWNQAVEQVLLIPEACVLLVLLLLAWTLNFPPIVSLLALVTVFLFGVRLGLMAVAEHALERGRYRRADALTSAALRLNPWSADALVLRAQGLSHRGADEEAEHVLRRAAHLYPHDRAVQSALAASLLAQGRVTEGWQIARSSDPTMAQTPQIAQQLAWFALHVEENAAKARTTVLRTEPEHLLPVIGLPLLVTLAEAEIVLGAQVEAQQHLIVIERELPACPQPQQAELLYHLGRLHTVLGENGAAYFRRSVEIDPQGRYAQTAWRSAVNARV